MTELKLMAKGTMQGWSFNVRWQSLLFSCTDPPWDRCRLFQVIFVRMNLNMDRRVHTATGWVSRNGHDKSQDAAHASY